MVARDLQYSAERHHCTEIVPKALRYSFESTKRATQTPGANASKSFIYIALIEIYLWCREGGRTPTTARVGGF
jgi:hypothetical protein